MYSPSCPIIWHAERVCSPSIRYVGYLNGLFFYKDGRKIVRIFDWIVEARSAAGIPPLVRSKTRSRSSGRRRRRSASKPSTPDSSRAPRRVSSPFVASSSPPPRACRRRVGGDTGAAQSCYRSGVTPGAAITQTPRRTKAGKYAIRNTYDDYLFRRRKTAP